MIWRLLTAVLIGVNVFLVGYFGKGGSQPIFFDLLAPPSLSTNAASDPDEEDEEFDPSYIQNIWYASSAIWGDDRFGIIYSIRLLGLEEETGLNPILDEIDKEVKKQIEITPVVIKPDQIGKLHDKLFFKWINREQIWKLALSRHPYTWHALRNPHKRILFGPTHENVYYARAAELIRSPQSRETIVKIGIINFDPHLDHKVTPSQSFNPDFDLNGYQKHGVSDATWAYAIVRDGLAPYVIGIGEAPVVGFNEPMQFISLVYRNDSGEVEVLQAINDPNAFLQMRDREQLLAGALAIIQIKSKINEIFHRYPRCWVTVDFDRFSLRDPESKKTDYHFEPQAWDSLIQEMFTVLQGYNVNPEKVILAESVQYLDPRADADYRRDLRIQLETKFNQYWRRNSESVNGRHSEVSL